MRYRVYLDNVSHHVLYPTMQEAADAIDRRLVHGGRKVRIFDQAWAKWYVVKPSDYMNGIEVIEL